ncbi:hypothetical protein GGQ54_000976 [Naumannella cuiyingiana]|uniref:DinB-like domain-containing protein n=1 Tax=Naumannella cuiyingiana TaxID=1347891 RepID=A0A7Z0IKD5_9ACTN|nr:DinB family protein [Naumannella cuiyingiana]NYI70416.1 hypothetical protein [Naumannella cuiyingiana]
MSNVNATLREQLDWHWTNQLRPRLAGLTDEEYLFEPAPGAWTVHPREQDRTPMQAGSGAWVIDFALPEPSPPPLTTIAWRLGHLIVGVFGMRNAGHFGGPPADYFGWDYAPDAATALDQLDEGYARWQAGVAGLGEEGLWRPAGETEGPHADQTMATLVLHINREVIHHGAEIALLRDLWTHRKKN